VGVADRGDLLWDNPGVSVLFFDPGYVTLGLCGILAVVPTPSFAVVVRDSRTPCGGVLPRNHLDNVSFVVTVFVAKRRRFPLTIVRLVWRLAILYAVQHRYSPLGIVAPKQVERSYSYDSHYDYTPEARSIGAPSPTTATLISSGARFWTVADHFFWGGVTAWV
jgi:hypothetical protein